MYIGYRSPCLSGVYRRVALHIARRIFKSWPARDDLFETTDRNNGIKELQEGVEENIRFARQIDEAKKAATEPYLVEAHIGAHAPFTVPDAGLEMLHEAVKATGRGLHIHAAEDLYDVSYSHHWYGKDLLARLAQFDLIDSKTLVAHGLYLSKDDIALLNQRDAFLVHNARSNMNNHVGYNHHLSDIRNLALGTDGIGSDMFEEMKFAFFKHRDAVVRCGLTVLPKP
ncbi:putative amidohydrolase [Escherichia coli]|uniref:Putative amidohydrolase n=1 Tax=Escherichia coli TaxID=562 RepID=A0A377AEF0_ECOLX|nr:putative amidohydrolase [Escherichia coli]